MLVPRPNASRFADEDGLAILDEVVDILAARTGLSITFVQGYVAEYGARHLYESLFAKVIDVIEDDLVLQFNTRMAQKRGDDAQVP